MKDGLETFRRQVGERGEPGAVVVGLNPAGLGVVRALGRRGTPVLGVSSNFADPASHTRFCGKVSCPDIDGPPLLDTLLSISQRFDRPPVLFLSGDLCVRLVSHHREELQSRYRFLLPAKDKVELLLDKGLFTAYALENHLPIPATFRASDVAGVRRVAAVVDYPCIVKPVFRNQRWEKTPTPKAFTASSRDQLLAVYDRIVGLQKDVVIQEWIPGPDSEIYFCLVYFDGSGTPLVHFEGRKLFQWVPACGSTAIAEPVACDAVQAESLRFLQAIGFKGMVSVECKRDPRDGRFKIMEPTVGRPNLQSDTATACGINIPCIVYDDLAGVPAAGRDGRKVRDRKWIYEENAFDLIRYRTHYGVTFSAIMQSVKGNRCYALLARDDPGPFLKFLTNVFRRAIKRLGTRGAA